MKLSTYKTGNKTVIFQSSEQLTVYCFLKTSLKWIFNQQLIAADKTFVMLKNRSGSSPLIRI